MNIVEAGVRIAAIEISNALSVIANPLSSADSRKKAHEVLENFKNSSPFSAPCGFFLSSKHNEPLVRHFGLQLVEHCIKFRWNDLVSPEKHAIKDKIMAYMHSGTDHVVKEHGHIKDLVSRCVVEIIKREWPQHWGNLMDELRDLCCHGETQTELVLMVFMRLAEDLILFPNLFGRRKKDIQQALSRHMGHIIIFFMKNLIEHSTKYNELVTVLGQDNEQVLAHCRLTETTLRALGSYLDWVPQCHLKTESFITSVELCRLLDNKAFRFPAIDCLLSIVDRKLTIEDRKLSLDLFSPYPMNFLSTLVSNTVNITEEDDYNFAKKLCQMFVCMGAQIVALSTMEPQSGRPQLFKEFLNNVFIFTMHPSIYLNSGCYTMWTNFVQHAILSEDEDVKAVMRQLLEVSCRKLVRVTNDNMDETEKRFADMEFECWNDHFTYINAFRNKVIQILKFITKVQPVPPFKYGAETLTRLLETRSTGNEKSCAPSIGLQLDALSYYLDAISNQLFTDGNLKLCPEGIDLLKMLLTIETEDVALLSSVLSCMSALFIFLEFDISIMPTLLDKLFFAAILNPPKGLSDDWRQVKEYHRHSAGCIVKICKCYSSIMVPAFDQIFSLVKDMFKEMENDIPLEKYLVVEALVLISNEAVDFNKQSLFMEELLGFVTEPWKELKKITASPDEFLSFLAIGTSADPNDLKRDERAKVLTCLNFLFHAVKRSKWPDNIQAAEKGGFLVKDASSTAGSYMRCPATAHLLPLLEEVFSLIRLTNVLHEPTVLSSLSAETVHVVDIPECKKKELLAVLYEPHRALNLPAHVKNINFFIYSTTEICLQLLGYCAQYCGVEFYCIPDLASLIKSSVLSSLEYLPDHRVKDIFRSCIRPLIVYCPSSCYSIIASVMEGIYPVMLQKLSTRWEKYKEQYGTNISCENETTETQEILEDQLNRMLTREFVDLMAVALKNSRKAPEMNLYAMDEDTDESMGKTQNNASGTDESLSDLGILLLRTEGLRATLVCALFKALQWLDTSSSFRSCNICFGVIDQLVEDKLITTDQEASFLMQCVLYALSELGEHDVNQNALISLCLHLYEKLRMGFPCIREVFLQDFQCPTRLLERFDTLILHSINHRPCPERKKKFFLKDLIAGVIGKHVGQYFKHEIRIKNLPKQIFYTRQKNFLPENAELNLCTLFSKEEHCTS